MKEEEMSRKTVALLCLAPLFFLGRASAITYGVPDGGDHPNVGAFVVEDDTGHRDIWCTGTLISPTVFLTAAHCTVDPERLGFRVFVTFDTKFTPKSKLYEGTPHTNPGYNQAQGDPGDVAVVTFASPIRGITPAALPSEGLFDRMAADHTLHDQLFTAVGYGVHQPTPGGGPMTFPFTSDRWRSVSSFNALNQAWLRLSQNNATGDGGTCYGDSGGPNFLGAGAGETPMIAAVTVTGDFFCLATNVTYRLDTPAARAFLSQFVTLP
jgi:trypsin